MKAIETTEHLKTTFRLLLIFCYFSDDNTDELQGSESELRCGWVCMCAHVTGEAAPMLIKILPDQLVYKDLLEDKKGMKFKQKHHLVSKIILLLPLKIWDLASIYLDTVVNSVVTSTYILTENWKCVLSSCLAPSLNLPVCHLECLEQQIRKDLFWNHPF